MNFSLHIFLILIFSALALFGCSSHTPAPIVSLDPFFSVETDSKNANYDNVDRGEYNGNYYKVAKGDTLYFIAYITNKDVQEIAHNNNLAEPYTIYPGQILKLWSMQYQRPNLSNYPQEKNNELVQKMIHNLDTNDIAQSTTKSYSNINSNNNVTDVAKVEQDVNNIAKLGSVQDNAIKIPKPTQQITKSTIKTSTNVVKLNNNNNDVQKYQNHSVSKWLWPTKGRVIAKFSLGDQGNKGIDIAGKRGQSIVATAAGSVVYSGDALRGYGNLIIIRHNNDYLSAYAHNDTLLVSEGQNVTAGQKIATMGSSGIKTVQLHFEIRYQGKSIDPEKYLP